MGKRVPSGIQSDEPEMTERPIKLLLVDTALVRLGLRAVLSCVPRFSVVGEASTAAEAIALARQLRPDLVIMNVDLPDGSGIEACREICSEQPAPKVLMLTAHTEEEAVVESVLAGASGYLLKQNTAEDLMEAIETVARGDSLLDPTITRTILRWLRQRGMRAQLGPLGTLSEQERKILPLIAEGKTNREIGAVLILSENTVKTYVSNILHKLQRSSRSELAAFSAGLRRRARAMSG